MAIHAVERVCSCVGESNLNHLGVIINCPVVGVGDGHLSIQSCCLRIRYCYINAGVVSVTSAGSG